MSYGQYWKHYNNDNKNSIFSPFPLFKDYDAYGIGWYWPMVLIAFLCTLIIILSTRLERHHSLPSLQPFCPIIIKCTREVGSIIILIILIILVIIILVIILIIISIIVKCTREVVFLLIMIVVLLM